MRCCVNVCIVFFFFKQKTAYEMRISDWSSDVCSSDLGEHFRAVVEVAGELRPADMLEHADRDGPVEGLAARGKVAVIDQFKLDPAGGPRRDGAFAGDRKRIG